MDTSVDSFDHPKLYWIYSASRNWIHLDSLPTASQLYPWYHLSPSYWALERLRCHLINKSTYFPLFKCFYCWLWSESHINHVWYDWFILTKSIMSTASMNYFGSWNNSEKYGLLFSAAILFVSLSYLALIIHL